MTSRLWWATKAMTIVTSQAPCKSCARRNTSALVTSWELRFSGGFCATPHQPAWIKKTRESLLLFRNIIFSAFSQICRVRFVDFVKKLFQLCLNIYVNCQSWKWKSCFGIFQNLQKCFTSKKQMFTFTHSPLHASIISGNNQWTMKLLNFVSQVATLNSNLDLNVLKVAVECQDAVSVQVSVLLCVFCLLSLVCV